jgi:NADH:ubiquinone oxidoreductase subunit 5 (subunit L)/multisubunit Na+/H+ antiporter MnhA subunit
MSAWTRTYVLGRIELARFTDALRRHWRRILVGAFVGWGFAVVGGAFALASLEFHGLVSGTTSDELGIVIVLYGVGIGALNAYTFRPREAERARR